MSDDKLTNDKPEWLDLRPIGHMHACRNDYYWSNADFSDGFLPSPCVSVQEQFQREERVDRKGQRLQEDNR
jgi:hypothetical protein